MMFTLSLKPECWHVALHEQGSAPHMLEGISACSHFCDNVGLAALKQSIERALAAFAASPFQIEGGVIVLSLS